MRRLTYRGYFSLVEFFPEDNLCCGILEGISDLVDFMGDTPEEAETAFHEAVDDYLAFCEEMGKEPCQPCQS